MFLTAAAWSCVPLGNANATRIYAVSQDQSLFSFDSFHTDTVLSGVFISGLQSNETIQAIDFRPATGELYALGSTSRIYKLDLNSGVATQVGPTLSTTLNGTAFDMDFNPVTDELRIVSNTRQNLRVNPNTGAIINVDTPLHYVSGDPGAPPAIVGLAYKGDVAYCLDHLSNTTGFDYLSTLSPANDGALNRVATVEESDSLRNESGFDIDVNGIAYYDLESFHVTSLYVIDLTNGHLLGNFGGGPIGGGGPIRDFAAVTPEPASGMAMLILAGAVSLSRRR